MKRLIAAVCAIAMLLSAACATDEAPIESGFRLGVSPKSDLESIVDAPLVADVMTQGGDIAITLACPGAGKRAKLSIVIDDDGMTLLMGLSERAYVMTRPLKEEEALTQPIITGNSTNLDEQFKKLREYFAAADELLDGAKREEAPGDKTFDIWGRAWHEADTRESIRTDDIPFSEHETFVVPTHPDEKSFYIEGERYFKPADESTNDEDIIHYDFDIVSVDDEGAQVERNHNDYFHYVGANGQAHNQGFKQGEKDASIYFADYEGYINYGLSIAEGENTSRFELFREDYEDERIKGVLDAFVASLISMKGDSGELGVYSIMGDDGVSHNVDAHITMYITPGSVPGSDGAKGFPTEPIPQVVGVYYEGKIREGGESGVAAVYLNGLQIPFATVVERQSPEWPELPPMEERIAIQIDDDTVTPPPLLEADVFTFSAVLSAALALKAAPSAPSAPAPENAPGAFATAPQGDA